MAITLTPLPVTTLNDLAAEITCLKELTWRTRASMRIASLYRALNGAGITPSDIQTLATEARCLLALPRRTRQAMRISLIHTLLNA